MEFKKELLMEVMEYSIGEEIEFEDEELDSEYKDTYIKIIEVGDWISEGKYEYCWWVFEYNDKYYMLTNSRSGSYYSDYYYGSDDWDGVVDCDEVERVEVVTHDWRIVK